LQRDAGLSLFGFLVMALLSEAPGRSRRMSELATLANGSLSRLSHLVSRLEARGWVRRERPDDDGRGQVAVLTDAGYDKVVATAPGHVEEVRRLVFDALTPEQVRAMDEICRAIGARLATDGSSGASHPASDPAESACDDPADGA
ncbi:MAG: MarR family winged helix-turn-helix transcriptional regulator, partial [Dehalococcoidia bacterium]|nr:MarR family winged helix-turn-helix transcriptional regulator [Dehalococcoidia bacterium]